MSTQDANVVVPSVEEPIRIGIRQSLTGTMCHSETSVADAILLAVEELWGLSQIAMKTRKHQLR